MKTTFFHLNKRDYIFNDGPSHYNITLEQEDVKYDELYSLCLWHDDDFIDEMATPFEKFKIHSIWMDYDVVQPDGSFIKLRDYLHENDYMQKWKIVKPLDKTHGLRQFGFKR